MSEKKLTMGQLRARLYQAIDDVATGDLEPARATAIAKLAAQMNQSLLTEIEVAKLQLKNECSGVGTMEIASGDIKTLGHSDE